MKRALISGMLVLVLVVLVVAAACATPAPTPAPTATPVPGATLAPTTPSTPGKTYKWRAAMFGTEAESPYYAWFAKRLEEASGERIKVDVLWGGQHPLGVADYETAVRDRVFEMGYLSPAYMQTQDLITAAASLPLITPGASFAERNALYEKLRPVLYDPFTDKWNMISLFWAEYGEMALATKTGPITGFKDLKGLKLRVYNAVMGQMDTLMGAIPVTLPYEEVYPALQRGIIDGLHMTPPYMYISKLYEVDRYHVLGLGFFEAVSLGLNKDAFNELPPDLQQVVLDVGKEIEKEARDWMEQQDAVGAVKGVREYGVTLTAASRSFAAEAYQRMQPLYADFIAKTGDRGANNLKAIEQFHKDWLATH
ncbi:MAG: TRAP transporter substrate-binding protein [Chloroflexi bacterium]|nr:TRAP transporter substrate-binding protein [Chloroflexota bacterium]